MKILYRYLYETRYEYIFELIKNLKIISLLVRGDLNLKKGVRGTLSSKEDVFLDLGEEETGNLGTLVDLELFFHTTLLVEDGDYSMLA